MHFERITVEPDKMGGVPCIRGLRIPVATVVGMVAEGMTAEEILQAYPDLEHDDVREALQYAARRSASASCPSDAALEVSSRRERLPARGRTACQRRPRRRSRPGHRSTQGSDPTVLASTADNERVLVTLDTDFGALIAHSGAHRPSVVLFRGDVTRRPSAQAALLLANLDQLAGDLDGGAVAVIGDDRVRVRRLPIDRS